MRKLWFVPLALATVLATVPAAKADPVGISFSGSGPSCPACTGDTVSINGSGSLTGSWGAGGYYITGGSITVDGITSELDLVAVTGSTSPSSYLYTDNSVLFTYDNAVISQAMPYLDGYGLLFETPGASSSNGGQLINFYSVDGLDYWNMFTWGTGWQIMDPPSPNGDVVDLDMTGLPVITPEPSPWLLLSTGLILLTGLLLRKAKPGTIQSV